MIGDVIGICLFFVCITETPEAKGRPYVPRGTRPIQIKIERAPTREWNVDHRMRGSSNTRASDWSSHET